MPDNLCWLRFQPPGNPLLCVPSCIEHSGSRANWGDTPARGSIRHARSQRMRRSFRALADRQAATGRPPRNDHLSTNIRRSRPLAGETTRRYSYLSDRRLHPGTNKEVCPGAHLPACPGGLKLTPPISDPPMLNRTQVSKRNISPQQGRRSAIEFGSADLKCRPTVRMLAQFFLSISVARRCRERMFSFFAHKGANRNCGVPPTFYGSLQETRFVMVHRRP